MNLADAYAPEFMTTESLGDLDSMEDAIARSFRFAHDVPFDEMDMVTIMENGGDTADSFAASMSAHRGR